MTDFVILVDRNDREIGVGNKLEVHKTGQLHRAFSILLFNDKKELLLQQRSLSKYHSATLWTNCCCSHPKPDEDIFQAAKRRLKEELLIDEVILLEQLNQFVYYTKLENNLIEHEYDHVLIGHYNKTPIINPEEAMGYKWESIESIKKLIEKEPNSFSFWFKEIISQFCNEIEQHIDESLQKRNV